MARRLLVGISIVGALAYASVAAAHDFFLLPEQFTTPRAGTVAIQATVGSRFPTPEIVVTADRAERVNAIGAGSPRVRIAGAGAKALNLE